MRRFVPAGLPRHNTLARRPLCLVARRMLGACC